MVNRHYLSDRGSQTWITTRYSRAITTYTDLVRLALICTRFGRVIVHHKELGAARRPGSHETTDVS